MRVVMFKPAAYVSKSMSYNVDKVDYKHVFPCGVANIPNFKGDTSFAIMKTFASFAQQSKRTKKIIMHLSVNPSTQERKNPKMANFFMELMSRMGYGRQPYVVYLHYDIERPHFHIMSVRVDANGNGLRVYDDIQQAPILASRHEHRRCYRICKSLCQKYGFSFEGVDSALDGQDYEVFDQSKGNIWRQYDTIAEKVLHRYSFTSVDEYLAVLLTKGVAAREYEIPLKDNKTGDVCAQMRIVCDTYDAHGHKRAKCHFLPLRIMSDINNKLNHSIPLDDVYSEAMTHVATTALKASTYIDIFKNILRECAITPVFQTIDGIIDSVTLVDDVACRCVDIHDVEFVQEIRRKKTERYATAIGARESFSAAKERLMACRITPAQPQNKVEKQAQKQVIKVKM